MSETTKDGQIALLESEIRRLKDEILALLHFVPRDGRCPKHPAGERCGRKVWHDGACQWDNGD